MDDLISRQAVIDSYGDWYVEEGTEEGFIGTVKQLLEGFPSAQPEIIRCRNCKFASGDSRICMKFGHSPIGELDFCAWAERKDNG